MQDANTLPLVAETAIQNGAEVEEAFTELIIRTGVTEAVARPKPSWEKHTGTKRKQGHLKISACDSGIEDYKIEEGEDEHGNASREQLFDLGWQSPEHGGAPTTGQAGATPLTDLPIEEEKREEEEEDSVGYESDGEEVGSHA
jgi:hypothetical protein